MRGHNIITVAAMCVVCGLLGLCGCDRDPITSDAAAVMETPLCSDAEKVDARPSSAIVLLTPARNAMLDNGCSSFEDPIQWEFTWATTVAPVSKYHLYVRHKDAGVATIDEAHLTEPRFRFDISAYVANHNCQDWHWRVRAMIRGQWTEWSEKRTYCVEPLNTDCRAEAKF